MDSRIAVAQAILDANPYVVLGTADAAGVPWVSPVYFAHENYRRLLWMSSPEAEHSRNLATRPEVSLVVFDSRVAVGQGQAVYMVGRARELSGEALASGVRAYPGDGRGGREVPLEQLRTPAPYRLYEAVVTQHWILCPRESGPCTEHHLAYDHRTPVALS